MFRLFLWKTQKDVTMSNAFQTFLDASRQEPNRTWLDEDNEFLQDNYVKICSTNSKRKSFVTERLKGLWKKKQKKNNYLNPVLENVYIHQLDEVGNKYNNT